jgi:hypothetical protein
MTMSWFWAAVGGRTQFNWTVPTEEEKRRRIREATSGSSSCLNAGAVVQGVWDWTDWYTVNITALWSTC